MNRLLSTIVFFVLLNPVMAQEPVPKLQSLTMTLAWVADSEDPIYYVYVINGVLAYKTLDGLKNYLKNMPRGSSLTWSPGCCLYGSVPLLESNEEMNKFKEFCKSAGIQFTLVPRG